MYFLLEWKHCMMDYSDVCRTFSGLSVPSSSAKVMPHAQENAISIVCSLILLVWTLPSAAVRLFPGLTIKTWLDGSSCGLIRDFVKVSFRLGDKNRGPGKEGLDIFASGCICRQPNLSLLFAPMLHHITRRSFTQTELQSPPTRE
ncbi:hypothetical protein VTI28DRAFT_7528 [Corynascus sepedonium]